MKLKTGHYDVNETLENLDKENTKTELTDIKTDVSKLKISSDIVSSSSESTLWSKRVKHNDIIDSKIKIPSSSPLNYFESSESNMNTVISSNDPISNTPKILNLNYFTIHLIILRIILTAKIIKSKQNTVATKVHITAQVNKNLDWTVLNQIKT